MLTKSSVVLLGLVVGFVSILTTPTTAQEGPPGIWHRVCTIAPGQGPDAVAFAREVADYFDEKWPELNIVTFRPALLPNNLIHWVTEYENMGAFAASQAVIFRDRGIQALLQKAQMFFVPATCRDDLSVNLR